jgi:membrane fusion protein (multidrug efflux system)
MTDTATQSPPPEAAIDRSRRRQPLVIGLVTVVVVTLVVGVVAPEIYRYATFRTTHSITEDAFIEAPLIHVAPQLVTGRLDAFPVEENDRVAAGEVIARIDPTPFADQLTMAEAKLGIARAELKRQQVGLAKVRKEVPLSIALAEQTYRMALAEQEKAEQGLAFTRDEVAGNIEASAALVAVARSNHALASSDSRRFTSLAEQEAVPARRMEEANTAAAATKSELDAALAKQRMAKAGTKQIAVAEKNLTLAEAAVKKAALDVAIAETGWETVTELEQMVELRKEAVRDAKAAVTAAQHTLAHTEVTAPSGGIIVHKAKHAGDEAPPGLPIATLLDPESLHVIANLEETRLAGVNPGNRCSLEIDALDTVLRGRVLWINRATGAEFSLLPRDVVAGEFTKVVQRVPVRIEIERDEHWDALRAGMSVRVTIAHGPGDPEWVNQAEAARVAGRGEPKKVAGHQQGTKDTKKTAVR